MKSLQAPSFFFEKIKKYDGVKERVLVTFSLIRGLILSSFVLKRRAYIVARGKPQVIMQNGDVVIENFTTLRKKVRFICMGSEKERALIRIGQKTEIGAFTTIHAGKEVRVGERVNISAEVIIMDRDYHSIREKNEIIKPVIIEDDVLICCRAMILKGVRVGHHAVVGAGAVVTKNVEPYSIVAGNPARVVGRRYCEPEDNVVCALNEPVLATL
jgi:acetyltransferase-like isoleucine patch superfamily enzyme